jgi:hypothetical protein
MPSKYSAGQQNQAADKEADIDPFPAYTGDSGLAKQWILSIDLID